MRSVSFNLPELLGLEEKPVAPDRLGKHAFTRCWLDVAGTGIPVYLGVP
jgi:hypothetical protein